MYSHANYTVVGLFVVLLGIALIAAGLWISSDFTRVEEHRYLVLPEEPMTGLSQNSQVKYQGIDVGRVREMGLDDDGRVRILISIQHNVPVRADTRVSLASQGLTGLGHLELLPGTDVAGPPLAGDFPYPVLPNAPSLRMRLEGAVEEGLAGVNSLTRQLERLLSDDNIDTLNTTISHMERVTGTLADNSDDIIQTVRETGLLVREARQVLEDAPDSLAQVEQTLAGINDATQRVSAAATALEQTGDSSHRTLERLGRETLPQVNQLLLDIQGLAQTLERMGAEFSESPDRLLFGAPQRAPGPGETD